MTVKGRWSARIAHLAPSESWKLGLAYGSTFDDSHDRSRALTGPVSPTRKENADRSGFDPHVAYRINDCQMAQALVAAGEGIALLPRLMLRPAHPGVAIKPLATDPPSRRVSAVRVSTRYLTPATERFSAPLVAASADHAATHHGSR